MTPRHASVIPLYAAPSGPRAAVQGTLALDLGRPAPTVQPLAERRGTVRVVSPRPTPTPRRPQGIDARARRDLDLWARRYAQAAVEAVNGDRPASQLVRWTQAEVYADLSRRAHLVARVGGQWPGQGRDPKHVVRPTVRSAHVCFLAPDVAEVAVRVQYGARSRALALRFERVLVGPHGAALKPRWLCAALDFS